ARLPIKWVTGDSVYGSDSRLRRWLENEQQAYVLAVSAKESVSIGWNTYKVRDLAAQTPEEKWEIITCGNGSKGPRKYE
ncbi:IS701 family transposase, partial [Paenactinomyces guangxiensis]